MVLQMEYKPWTEEDPAGDRDPVASHAYAVAEAAAKAAGASPTAEVQSLSSKPHLQQSALQSCHDCAPQCPFAPTSPFSMRPQCCCLHKPTFAVLIMTHLPSTGS